MLSVIKTMDFNYLLIKIHLAKMMSVVLETWISYLVLGFFLNMSIIIQQEHEFNYFLKELKVRILIIRLNYNHCFEILINIGTLEFKVS